MLKFDQSKSTSNLGAIITGINLSNKISSEEIRSLSINAHTFAEKFTFNHYIKRMRKDILSN